MFNFLIQRPDIGLYSSWLLLNQFLFPQPKNCVNSPHSRACWKDGFDLHTDYEYDIPPGKLVEVNDPAEIGLQKTH